MKPKYDLVCSKDGKVVAKQDITDWTYKQVGELWLLQEEQYGRSCRIKKREVER